VILRRELSPVLTAALPSTLQRLIDQLEAMVKVNLSIH
jgi:hypothetical protein